MLSVLLSFQTSIDSAYGLSKMSNFSFFYFAVVRWEGNQTNTLLIDFFSILGV